ATVHRHHASAREGCAGRLRRDLQAICRIRTSAHDFQHGLAIVRPETVDAPKKYFRPSNFFSPEQLAALPLLARFGFRVSAANIGSGVATRHRSSLKIE